MLLAAAARRPEAFYMGPALALASRYPNVRIIAAVDELPAPRPGFVAGSPLAHIPELCATDIVYAAGSPRLVDAIAKRAVEAGATFHADPFSPSGTPSRSWLEAAKTWLRTG
ncbi:MAG: hypothetical protein JSS20_20375 [Proteobacteria bacterium]|nr:hypothetical protein [Pseudomonadota bacterium]